MYDSFEKPTWQSLSYKQLSQTIKSQLNKSPFKVNTTYWYKNQSVFIMIILNED